jgi:hypothetical protein
VLDEVKEPELEDVYRVISRCYLLADEAWQVFEDYKNTRENPKSVKVLRTNVQGFPEFDKKYSLFAETIKVTNGLAIVVDPAVDSPRTKAYFVIHISSGLSLGGECETLKKAKSLFHRLINITDWSVSKDQIKSDESLVEKIKEAINCPT